MFFQKFLLFFHLNLIVNKTLKIIEFNKSMVMFEKLIKAIEAISEAEAQKLIAEIDITELRKVDKYGNTALTLAAMKGLEKICEALIPKMSEQAINQVTNTGNTALTLTAMKGLEKICEA